MRDLMKWNIALARLSNFIEKFPSCPDEDHIFQYHEIIGLFEEASGDELSRFRISPYGLSPRINGASRTFGNRCVGGRLSSTRILVIKLAG